MGKQKISRPYVLIVDDEPAVRTVARRMLEPAGYIVEEAVDPIHACDRAEKKEHLDLLVADYRMPELTGGEVARRIRTAKPNIKVLFITGFPDDLFDEKQALWEGESFLEKPFSQNGLLEAASLLLFGKLYQEQLFAPDPPAVLRNPRSWGFTHGSAVLS
jgi:CheY-like chemotaxis protein